MASTRDPRVEAMQQHHSTTIARDEATQSAERARDAAADACEALRGYFAFGEPGHELEGRYRPPNPLDNSTAAKAANAAARREAEARPARQQAFHRRVGGHGREDWADAAFVRAARLNDTRVLRALRRGVGMERLDAPRLRLFCRPEVMVIDVLPEPTS